MVCGMLDRRIVRVTLFRLRELNREAPFTLPKPLVHLLCNFVNIVFTGSTRAERAGLH